MDFAAALALAETAVETLIKVEPLIIKGVPVVIQAVKDFKPFVTAFVEKLTGKPITEDQRTELEAKIDDLHSRFQAPIPPENEQ